MIVIVSSLIQSRGARVRRTAFGQRGRRVDWQLLLSKTMRTYALPGPLTSVTALDGNCDINVSSHAYGKWRSYLEHDQER